MAIATSRTYSKHALSIPGIHSSCSSLWHRIEKAYIMYDRWRHQKSGINASICLLFLPSPCSLNSNKRFSERICSSHRKVLHSDRVGLCMHTAMHTDMAVQGRAVRIVGSPNCLPLPVLHPALDADHMALILRKTRSLLTSRGLLLCCIAFIFLVSCRVEPFISTFCTFTPLATGIERIVYRRQVSLPLSFFRHTYTHRYQIEPRPSITIPITKHSILHHLTYWNKENTAFTTILPIYPHPYPVVFKV